MNFWCLLIKVNSFAFVKDAVCGEKVLNLIYVLLDLLKTQFSQQPTIAVVVFNLFCDVYLSKENNSFRCVGG